MKKLKEINDWDLNTSRSDIIDDNRKLPKPTEQNMRKLVDQINDLTKVVNTLAKRQGLIDEEEDKDIVKF